MCAVFGAADLIQLLKWLHIDLLFFKFALLTAPPPSVGVSLLLLSRHPRIGMGCVLHVVIY